MVCSCIGGYPLPFTIVPTRTLRDRNTIIMVIIILRWPSKNTIIMFIITLRRSGRGMIIVVNLMLPWRLLVLKGAWPKELPEYARLTRKMTQQCANWLVSPYSHIWAVCRIYSTHPNFQLGQFHRKIDLNDRSHHCICMFLHLTSNSGVTYWVFLWILKPCATTFFRLRMDIPVRLTTASQLKTIV